MTIDMENYEKKEVIKNFNSSNKEIVKCSQHGKLHGFVHFSKKQLNEKRTVTLSGIGGAVNKAISTAELLKKDLDLHQTNTIYFVTITEVWIPKDNQNLQNIEVERKVPAISIRLDVDEPAEKQLGYQPPELKSSPNKPIPRQSKFKKFGSKPKEKEDYPFPNHQKHLESKYRPRKQHKNGDREQTSNYKGKQKSKKKFNGNQRENGVFDRNSGKGDTESPVHNSKSSIHDQSINQDNGQEQTAMEQ